MPSATPKPRRSSADASTKAWTLHQDLDDVLIDCSSSIQRNNGTSSGSRRATTSSITPNKERTRSIGSGSDGLESSARLAGDLQREDCNRGLRPRRRSDPPGRRRQRPARLGLREVAQNAMSMASWPTAACARSTAGRAHARAWRSSSRSTAPCGPDTIQEMATKRERESPSSRCRWRRGPVHHEGRHVLHAERGAAYEKTACLEAARQGAAWQDHRNTAN